MAIVPLCVGLKAIVMSKKRSEIAEEITRSAGELAVSFFDSLGTLKIEDKGHQDFVSEADKAVETEVRRLIEASFPEDGIVGEEHAAKPSQSGYTWVIDPIDGTTNFISGIPAWTVVVAIVKGSETEVGITFDPIHDEMFVAVKGQGARLNGNRVLCPCDVSISKGSIGTGFSNRVGPSGILNLVRAVILESGVFHRNASGALSLAYVADGRLIGYVEEHMNAWDCLAGQLLVAEAGGQIERQDAADMIANGGRVVVGGAGVFDDLVRMADAAYGT